MIFSEDIEISILHTDVIFEHEICRRPTDRREVISRIVPCGRHFHPSASNCCYCNRKSVKICAICGSINLKRYFLKNIILTDEIVPTDELSSHRLHTQIIFHAEEHGLFRTLINRIERIFHPDHIYAFLYYTACLSMLNRLYSCVIALLPLQVRREQHRFVSSVPLRWCCRRHPSFSFCILR